MSNLIDVINISDRESCISLQISQQNKCYNCISWEDRRLSRPGKLRDSKCQRPWELKDKVSFETVHDRTLKKVCSSWDDMIHASVFKNTDIPPIVRKAGLKISHDFATSCKIINHPHTTENIQPTRRSSSRARKPERLTPKDRYKKVNKTGRVNENIHDEQRKRSDISSSSPFKQPTIFNNVIGNLENRFSSTLNLVGNACSNLRNVADDNINIINQEEEDVDVNSLKVSGSFVVERRISKVRSSTLHQQQQEILLLREKYELLERELNKARGRNGILKDRIINLEYQLNILKKKGSSSHHEVVPKAYFSRLEKYKNKIETLYKHLISERYSGKSDLGRRLLGEILATHPSISFVNAAEIIMLSRAQLLAETDIIDEKKLTLQNIALSSPSEKYLRTILDDTASDIMFQLYFRIFYKDKIGEKSPSLFLSCDKATNGGFIKIISWYSQCSNKVEQFIFDVDRSYGESRECAKAM